MFIEGCGLPQRFARLSRHRFVVGETGFGFGTNFLLTCAAWRASAGGASQLHYVAFESSPPDPAQLRRWHAATGLDASELIARWPSPVRGVHRRHFPGNIHLTLVFDSLESSIELVPHADAWLLDGFSPSRNPEAWSAESLDTICQRLRPGGVVTSYSAAAALRHGLSEAGLSVERRDGFGRKRHMTRALAGGDWTPLPAPSRTIAVIGGGIAGSAVARSLSRHGADPVVIDPGNAPPTRPLVVFPYLSAQPEPFSRFSLAAFDYARAAYGSMLRRTGLFRIARDRDRQRFSRIARAFRVAGADIVRQATFDEPEPHAGLRFAQAGWVTEAPVREAIMLTDRASLQDDGSPRWHLDSGAPFPDVDAHIVASGSGIADMPLGLSDAVNILPGATAPVRLDPDPHLRTIVSGSFTLIPTGSGIYWLGATWPTAPNPVLEADLDTRVRLAFGCSVRRDAPEHGYRCTTRDRVPLVGGHAPLPGTSLCTAFGARGATHAPLAAEVCVSQLLDLPQACTIEAARALSPGRFRRRAERSG